MDAFGQVGDSILFDQHPTDIMMQLFVANQATAPMTRGRVQDEPKPVMMRRLQSQLPSLQPALTGPSFLGSFPYDVRRIIYDHFLPNPRNVKFWDETIGPKPKTKRHRALISLMQTCYTICDEIASILYRENTFELLIDETGFKFLKMRFPHSRELEKLGLTFTKFDPNNMFGFTRIRKLTIYIKDMFKPVRGSGSKPSGDMDMRRTLRFLTGILNSGTLRAEERGLASLTISAGVKAPCDGHRDFFELFTFGVPVTLGQTKTLYIERTARRARRGGPLVLDLVTQPLTKLQGLRELEIILPGERQYWTHRARTDKDAPDPFVRQRFLRKDGLSAEFATAESRIEPVRDWAYNFCSTALEDRQDLPMTGADFTYNDHAPAALPRRFKRKANDTDYQKFTASHSHKRKKVVREHVQEFENPFTYFTPSFGMPV